MPDSRTIPDRNQQFVLPGEHVYNTALAPDQEQAFRQWVQQNKVPFDPSASVSDYDMRGFYQALQSGDPRAAAGVNQNDKQLHYPDYWKTPYHQSFSAESQWANPATAPKWNEKDQLVTPDGQIVFDEKVPAAPTIGQLMASFYAQPEHPLINQLRQMNPPDMPPEELLKLIIGAH